MMTVYEKTGQRAKGLWVDFVAAFRPATIKTWHSSETSNWAAFRTSLGIILAHNRMKTNTQPTIHMVYWDQFSENH